MCVCVYIHRDSVVADTVETCIPSYCASPFCFLSLPCVPTLLRLRFGCSIFFPCHCRWVTNHHHRHHPKGKVRCISYLFRHTVFPIVSLARRFCLILSAHHNHCYGARTVAKPSSGRTCEIRNKIILIPFPAAFKLNLALHVNHRSVAGGF